jgi:Fe-S-cluster-containing hydrogenase component 2
MRNHAVRVDAARCTGCGACVEVCPVDAITLAKDKAWIAEEICTGCGVCVDSCPEGAIYPLVEGEVIEVPKGQVPTVHHPSPLVRAATRVVAVAGTGLLVQGARILGQILESWLSQRSPAQSPTSGLTLGKRGGGQQTRHRWRGG